MALSFFCGFPNIKNIRKESVVAYKTNDEKKMYNLDGEKIKCALGNKEFFWLGKKADKVVF